MSRTPIYHKKDRNYRVVFRSPKHWAAQRNAGGKGTREYDPWIDLHRPNEDKDRAIRIMHERCPLRED